MKKRCCNVFCSGYKNYGGRGITVCKEWKDNFQAFYDWSMSNGYQENLTIDRIDNNGNYCPENCRWVDVKTQSRNRRSNTLVTYNGETHCLAEWAEIIGIDCLTIRQRLFAYSWSVEKALTTPTRK